MLLVEGEDEDAGLELFYRAVNGWRVNYEN